MEKKSNIREKIAIGVLLSGLIAGIFISGPKKTANDKMGVAMHNIMKLGGGGSVKYKWTMGNSEYTFGFLDSAGHAWTVSTDTGLLGAGHGIQGIPIRVNTIPANKVMQMAIGGLHDMAFLSADSGRIFYVGSNNFCQMGNGSTSSTPDQANELLTDKFGNQFYNIAMVSGGWGPVASVPFYCAIKQNPGDTVWAWGNLTTLGGSACQEPTPFLIPGETPAKIYAQNSSIHVICTDGSLWVLGGTDDYAANTGVNATPTTFTKVSIPVPVSYLVKGNSFVFAVTTTGDSVYGFGEYGWLLKGQSSITFNPITTPTLLNSFMSSILPLDTMVAAHTAWMAIKQNGQLWSGGSNEVGLCGVGPTINWNTYTTNPAPTGGTPQYWNWDVGMGEFVTAPTQVTPGKTNWVAIFGGPQYSLYFYALDANGNLYFSGRDKAAGALDGIIPADSIGTRIAAAFHVSWNHVWLTPVFPLALVQSSVTTCPGCDNGLFSGTPCTYGIDAPTHGGNTGLAAVLTLTSSGNTIYASNAGSTTKTGYKINFRVLSQTAGTALQLGVIAGQTDTIVAAPGTYTFQQMIVDNAWDTVYTIQSITISATTNYYVSSSTGSDANPGTQAFPFASLAKVATLTLIPGDTVKFKCGDTWNGTLYPVASGTPGDPIVYSSYGTGPKPVITGFTTQSTWNNDGGGVYGSLCSKCKITTNLVIEDGVVEHMARWPNTGYRTFTAINSTSFTDASLPNSPSYIGMYAVVKDERFCIDTMLVAGQSSGVVTLAEAPTYTNLHGNGYFFEGGKALLDTTNEYYLNPANDSLYQYSVDAITNHTIQVSTSDTGVYLNNKYFLSFNQINFTGFNQWAVLANVDSSIVFSGCLLQYGGTQGVIANNVVKLYMFNDTLMNFNNNAMTITGSSTNHDIVQNSKIAFNGTLPGMGRPGGGGTYEGINNPWPFSTYSGNMIDSNGYIGIFFGGDSSSVFNNYFLTNGLVKSDGGHIYMHDADTVTYVYGRWIYNNVCINGYNDNAGVNYTSSDVFFGVYLDALTSVVDVYNNTLANNPSAGIFDHGPYNQFTYNNLYGNLYAQALFSEVAGTAVYQIVFKHNVSSFLPTSPLMLSFTTSNNDLFSFGIVDSNYYICPFGLNNVFYTQSSSDAGTIRSFASWKSNTSYDTHSVFENALSLLVYNSTSTGTTYSLPGNYIDVFGNDYNGSVFVSPYSSIILIVSNLGYVPMPYGSYIITH